MSDQKPNGPPNHRLVERVETCGDCVHLVRKHGDLYFTCTKYNVSTHMGCVCDDLKSFFSEPD